MKNWLFKDESVMVFQPELAQLLGLNEAIMLNQIHYWLEKSKNIIDGRAWVYNTYEDWQKQLLFLSTTTIRKTLKNLENKGLVISGNFNKSKLDRTKWYSINYDLLQDLINPSKESDNSTVTKSQCNCLEATVHVTDSDRPIPDNTTDITTEVNDNDNKDPEETLPKPKALEKANGKNSALRSVLNFYSSNIRLPSSYELEIFNSLLEEFKEPEIIVLALKQSIESNARNLRYAEKVLYNWLDKGIKTAEAAEKFIADYKKYKGDGIDGYSREKYWQNKCYYTKTPPKHSKWSGYKPPRGNHPADIHIEGLI